MLFEYNYDIIISVDNDDVKNDMRAAMKTVFVVDDNDINLMSAEEALSEHFKVFTLPSAVGMFELLKSIKPNLILLDVEMPGTTGFEAFLQLKSDRRYCDIAVIFLTSRSDEFAEVRGFELGAVDFIHKPFSKPILVNRIKAHLNIEDVIEQKTSELREQTEKLHRLKNSILSSLARIAEHRDVFTGEHIERTTGYVKTLIDAMLERDIYSDELKKWDLDAVVSSARLHDVGKISVPDCILNKPGKLTDEEFAVIKKHAVEGGKIIEKIMAESREHTFLFHAELFALCHHEKWDGTGYPYAIDGLKIPLEGRIMAIVDVYDALVSERPYKKPFSHETAIEIIKEGSGSHFDPNIVDVFLDIEHSLRCSSRTAIPVV